jgi:cellulose synthase (UDP-forming)
MIKEKNLIKPIIWLALFSLIAFLIGFIFEVGVGHPILYILLTTALGFKIIRVLYEWAHYYVLNKERFKEKSPTPKKQYTVDMFTTACPGEPYEMFEETLKAMVAVNYPHKSYLCDEGNDPKLKKLCADLGVIHVTRETHENAKAGNVNNALAQSNGELCVILDPDHVPYPEFLDHVLHPFDDPEVGYVQIVQAYKNQVETFVARAAAEQTYMFYGPMMEGMSEFGTAQAIGANCTFRREALESIGGHAPGLTEDMHTSMLLHSKGWKSVYIPKVLSRGLVPTSLAAYYSQQLKWSRGTFDLWFNLYPKLFKKFTTPQKLHYGLMPVYYLFGLITLIDIIVPSYSLLTGSYPWLLEPHIFFLLYLPFIIFHLMVRLYSQKWVHDSHEYGLHVFGGILRVGTWWIYIIGLIYTIINVKVPYIPTPKEHTQKNEFKLGLPNLIVSIFCIVSVFVGLNHDWHPYSLLMAVFAGSNAIIFFMAFAIGQSKWVFAIRNLWKKWKASKYIMKYEISYHKVSKIAVPSIILMLIVFSSFLIPLIIKDDKHLLNIEKTPFEKEIGGFYPGVHIPNDFFIENLNSLDELDEKWSIIANTLSWNEISLPINNWKTIVNRGKLPLIYWEPSIEGMPDYVEHADLSKNRKIYKYILDGVFDNYIDTVAISIRSLGFPVFLTFAPEMDNPEKPWSVSGENTSSEFISAWRYIFERFESLGVQNITWVWKASDPEVFLDYFPNGKSYPNSRFVDWIGVSLKETRDLEAFENQYSKFNEQIKSQKIEIPVLITQTSNSSVIQRTNSKAYKNIFHEIKKTYPEVLSYVFNLQIENFNETQSFIKSLKETTISILPELSIFEISTFRPFIGNKSASIVKPGKSIKGTSGNFSFLVNERDFYIKGICYSSGNEWREGFLPLTRKQLENDFKQIKNMGANTIRRYEPSAYDRNIIAVAEEFDLKVMYGFWFDPEVDYYADKSKLRSYEKKVLSGVKKYKDDKSIIAWNIGNETWGLLKKNFEKPYLTLTRRAYLEFLEDLAQKIKKIDPNRPVFTTEEHEYYQFASTVYELSAHSPSIDVVGVNSYYRESIEILNKTFVKFDTLRPYAVTEFGTKGYWSTEFGDYWNDSLLLEMPSLSKANWIAEQWEKIIEPNRGYNIGGMAFSWRDRYEGTATWFGFTDYQGRLKPSYYKLQSVWNKEKEIDFDFPEISIVGHWYPLSPKNSIWFSAATTNQYYRPLNYEWKIISELDWQESTKILNQEENKKFVELEIPKVRSNEKYRVYLYATDQSGNVITASRPLLIQSN